MSMSGVEPPSNFPLASCSGSNENQSKTVPTKSVGKDIIPQVQYAHEIACDVDASQEFDGRMTKIVPSNDVSTIFFSYSFPQQHMDKPGSEAQIIYTCKQQFERGC